MPGSGKSEAVKLCSKRAVVVRMGDRVWDEVKKRGLELNEKNVANIANNMREQFGMGIWAKRTIPFIKDSEIIIIDGIRCKEEVKIFKEAFGKKFVIIAIISNPNVRYQRILKRKRKDDTLTFIEFQDRENRELNWGLKNTIESADYQIENNGTVTDLKIEIEKLI